MKKRYSVCFYLVTLFCLFLASASAHATDRSMTLSYISFSAETYNAIEVNNIGAFGSHRRIISSRMKAKIIRMLEAEQNSFVKPAQFDKQTVRLKVAIPRLHSVWIVDQKGCVLHKNRYYQLSAKQFNTLRRLLAKLYVGEP